MKRARIWYNEQPVWGTVEDNQIKLETGEMIKAERGSLPTPRDAIKDYCYPSHLPQPLC